MKARIWTAGQLEALSRDEQDALFGSSIIRDLADVPPELQPLLDGVRARVERSIADPELPNA